MEEFLKIKMDCFLEMMTDIACGAEHLTVNDYTKQIHTIKRMVSDFSLLGMAREQKFELSRDALGRMALNARPCKPSHDYPPQKRACLA